MAHKSSEVNDGVLSEEKAKAISSDEKILSKELEDLPSQQLFEQAETIGCMARRGEDVSKFVDFLHRLMRESI